MMCSSGIVRNHHTMKRRHRKSPLQRRPNTMAPFTLAVLFTVAGVLVVPSEGRSASSVRPIKSESKSIHRAQLNLDLTPDPPHDNDEDAIPVCYVGQNSFNGDHCTVHGPVPSSQATKIVSATRGGGSHETRQGYTTTTPSSAFATAMLQSNSQRQRRPPPNQRDYRRRGAAVLLPNNGRLARYLQDKATSDDDEENTEDNAHNHHKGSGGLFSGALHQMEHRAKEKTGIKLGEKAAEHVFLAAERKGLSRVAERVMEIWERLITGRVGQRAAERAGESGLGRVGERAGERFGERFVERFGERALFAGAGERGAEQAAKRIAGQRALSRAERRMATGVADRVGERTAERALSRAERRMATGVADRVGERTAERTGQRLAERAADRAGDRYSKAARRSVARHIAEVGERTSETGLVLASRGKKAKVGTAVAVRSTERMVRSAARLFLIALPALGGFFALWLLKADVKRIKEVREEREEYEWRISGTIPSKRPCFSSLMFGGAAVADLVDALAHFIIAYAVLIELSHSKILRWEELSMICAVVSTIFAIAGEVSDHRMTKKIEAVSGYI